MIIEHWWGDVWTVERSDNVLVDIFVKMLITMFLIVITVVVLLTIVGAIKLYQAHQQRKLENEHSDTLPATEDKLIKTGHSLACPYCGNTKSLDIRPCVRCGHSF
jgi:hypothetical protein